MVRLDLDPQNPYAANGAMASVLLLYYHLLREGGITNDQTIYVNADDFDPFVYLNIKVPRELSDIDQTLLREGASFTFFATSMTWLGSTNQTTCSNRSQSGSCPLWPCTMLRSQTLLPSPTWSRPANPD
jgi:hypothetical protein